MDIDLFMGTSRLRAMELYLMNLQQALQLTDLSRVKQLTLGAR